MPKPAHLGWLVDTGKVLKTACGKDVQVLELNHTTDVKVLSAWAQHFRNQYCADVLIDTLKPSTMSRKDYLETIKFPSRTTKLGPGIRSGDFSEILLADYLEWGLNHWVPRLRWDMKPTADSSTTGCDIIGFYFQNDGKVSAKDALTIIESKANLSGSKPADQLQKAVNDSVKDDIRKAESLNYLRQRFIASGRISEANKVARFQSPIDQPYKEFCAAAAVFSTSGYDEDFIQATNTTTHPHHGNLKMIVVKGNNLMSLVHNLYQRAADEA